MSNPAFSAADMFGEAVDGEPEPEPEPEPELMSAEVEGPAIAGDYHLPENVLEGVEQLATNILAAPFEAVFQAVTKPVEGAREDGAVGFMKGVVGGAAGIPLTMVSRAGDGALRALHGVGRTVTDAVDGASGVVGEVLGVGAASQQLQLPSAARMAALQAADCTVHIPAVRMVNTDRLDAETVYYRIELLDGAKQLLWRVEHRYSEFDELHAQMAKVLNKEIAAALKRLLPTASTVSKIIKLSDSDVERRRAGLEAFLGLVLQLARRKEIPAEILSAIAWFLVPDKPMLGFPEEDFAARVYIALREGGPDGAAACLADATADDLRRVSKWEERTWEEGADDLELQDQLEVFSNTLKAWCSGEVVKLDPDGPGTVTVEYGAPPHIAAEGLSRKVLRADSADLRRARQHLNCGKRSWNGSECSNGRLGL